MVVWVHWAQLGSWDLSWDYSRIAAEAGVSKQGVQDGVFVQRAVPSARLAATAQDWSLCHQPAWLPSAPSQAWCSRGSQIFYVGIGFPWKSVPRDLGRSYKVCLLFVFFFNSDSEVMQNHFPCILLFKSQANVPNIYGKHKPTQVLLSQWKFVFLGNIQGGNPQKN